MSSPSNMSNRLTDLKDQFSKYGDMSRMSHPEKRLWVYLVLHCVGRALARKARLIASDLGWTWRQVMAVKASLVKRHGKKIGAAKKPPYGLFICAGDDEWREYAGVTRRTLRSHAQLDRALAKTVLREKSGQMRMFHDPRYPS